MEFAWKSIRKFVIRKIYEYSNLNSPIFSIFDDTIAEKTNPFSQVKTPIQET